EQVLTSHVVYLQVVAVAGSVRDRVERGQSAGPITRGDRRVDRYLVARSTGGSYALPTLSVARSPRAPWKAGRWPCRTRDQCGAPPSKRALRRRAAGCIGTRGSPPERSRTSRKPVSRRPSHT